MMKMILRAAVAAAFALGFSQAYAFHSGGVAECGGCHQMHDAPGTYLLVAPDASSTCLSCHESANDTGPNSYHVSTTDAKLATSPPLQRGPGGDFAWLKRTYGTGTSAETGDRHGHNIVAPSKGYNAVTGTSPGGSFSASNLGCTSCHDQHSSIRRFDAAGASWGRTGLPIAASGSYNNSPAPIGGKTAVGVYRILRGGGVTGVSNDGSQGVTFTSLFTAVVPSPYNRTESATQTRTAYGLGNGDWCGTCHAEMHSGTGNRHPVDHALSGGTAANYNAYVSSGIMTATGNSFTSLVPFAENTSDLSILKGHALSNDTYLTGPVATDQVSCMSCHRAHATGFMDMVRWQIENEFLTKADSAGNAVYCSTDGTPGERCALNRTNAEVTAAYYDRPAAKLGAYQRSLCNKCHAKD